MQPNDMQVMTWRPPLIRLTQIANPDMDGGQTTPCFVDPQHVAAVFRVRTGFHKDDSQETHPRVDCTMVAMHGMNSFLSVIETPEQVAALRDWALGHRAAPTDRPPSVVPLYGGRA